MNTDTEQLPIMNGTRLRASFVEATHGGTVIMNSHWLLLAMSQQVFQSVATQFADSQRSCTLTECPSCQSFYAPIPTMKFQHIAVFRERCIALGQEIESGRYYLAIPVNNGRIDYEERYELTPAEFKAISEDLASMEALADKCRRRKNDHRLIWQPSIERGTPWMP